MESRRESQEGRAPRIHERAVLARVLNGQHLSTNDIDYWLDDSNERAIYAIRPEVITELCQRGWLVRTGYADPDLVWFEVTREGMIALGASAAPEIAKRVRSVESHVRELASLVRKMVAYRATSPKMAKSRARSRNKHHGWNLEETSEQLEDVVRRVDEIALILETCAIGTAALDSALFPENGSRPTPSELYVECMRNRVTRQQFLDLAAAKLRAYFKEKGQYL